MATSFNGTVYPLPPFDRGSVITFQSRFTFDQSSGAMYLRFEPRVPYKLPLANAGVQG